LLENELFVWTGRYIGHKIKAHGMNYEVEMLSALPRVFKIDNFLSEAECDQIVKEAAADLKQSLLYTAGKEHGQNKRERTSDTAYVKYNDTLLDRAFGMTKVPRDPSYLFPDQMVQVIHYSQSGFFHPHHDAGSGPIVQDQGWYMNGTRNRFLTLFIYLNTLEEDGGGETAFIRWSDYPSFKADQYHMHERNPCDRAVVAVKPKKGTAVLFYNLDIAGHPYGKVELESLHSGCGVKKGEKWACNVWIYNKPIHSEESTHALRHAGLIE